MVLVLVPEMKVCVGVNVRFLGVYNGRTKWSKIVEVALLIYLVIDVSGNMIPRVGFSSTYLTVITKDLSFYVSL